MHLDNVTLLILDTLNYKEARYAVEQSTKEISFNDVICVSDKDFLSESEVKHSFIKMNKKISNTLEYSVILTKKLNRFIKTDFVLVIQHDGYIINPDMWIPEFLDYDYIGAEWKAKNWNNNTPFLVGNGGFSLRSKKLMDIVANEPTYNISGNEDAYICYYFKSVTESHGLKIAPVEIARKFSFEEIRYEHKTFGFHGKENFDKI